MTFTESYTVEAHLRGLFAGAASARPMQPAHGFARTGGRIAGLGWHYLTPAERDFFDFRLRSVISRGRQLQ